MLQAVGITVSRTQLLERSEPLRTELGAPGRFRSIDDEGEYRDQSLSLADTPFWCPKPAQILDDIETSVAFDPRAACREPLARSRRGTLSEKASLKVKVPEEDQRPPVRRERTRTITRRGTITGTLKEIVVPLYDEELTQRQDTDGLPITATRAGYELAKYLRAREFLVVHVFPSLDRVLPDVRCFRTATLVKLVAGLVYAAIALLRTDNLASFGAAGQALGEGKFQALARGDEHSLDAGLEILAGLPRLDLLGARKMVFIVDGLDTAVSDKTRDKVKRFENVLARLCSRERAHLIYTLSDSMVQLGQ
ncbi:hypothetical protein PFICI_14052 [Pestalotiopsis fici W106-1]|uniref:Uncharacterized protein n=1 Tax=Pestalotiopsis fici (strain W106-1 / CGMCC3.15140) TaxID=1229662 RepID=W3WMZ3_PESFW|nr:uncharacterized protein PFICI_14052 [Pestalotiopsis fici W106-1]ETS74186.1 hypothetical protein PFICI_14052 [Pestalotiopsis fici W106-1]